MGSSQSTRSILTTVLLLICLFPLSPYAQDASIDSLINIATSNKFKDTTRCNAFVDLGQQFRKKELDKALKYYSKAEEIIFKHSEADDPDQEYYAEARLRVLNGKGIIFRKLENYPEALSLYLQVYDLSLKVNDTSSISSVLFNIGAIYRYQGEFDKSLEKYMESLALREQTGDTNTIINCYNALGIVYRKMDDKETAAFYYREAIRLAIDRTDFDRAVQAYINLGVLHSKDYDLSEEYFNHALEIAEREGLEQYIAKAKYNLSGLFLNTDRFRKSVDYCLEALEIFEKTKAIRLTGKTHRRLWRAYQQLGDDSKALDHLVKHLNYLEKQNTDEDAKALVRIEMNHAFEKEKMADSLEFAKQQEVSEAKLEKADLEKKALFGGAFLFLIIAAVAYKSYRRKRNDNVIISREKERSEELLLNILPEETADELKETGAAKARSYDLVSVLFTDFKGFTMISEVLTPEELVAEIDYCYKEFDKIIERYGIEKIKTIGDAYMCAGGLPVKNKTNPVDTVSAALEIKDFMLRYKKQRDEEGRPGFEIRIGIHTGPVVAGIVGIKKFAYDIWGDAVNTAARMESSGEVGKVNISSSTYDHVKEQFNCEYRGKVAAKNKGEIDMYFVHDVISS